MYVAIQKFQQAELALLEGEKVLEERRTTFLSPKEKLTTKQHKKLRGNFKTQVDTVMNLMQKRNKAQRKMVEIIARNAE